MILSASRRTDIPAFFSDWFFRRIKEQYVCVRNPMNFHQVSKICLSPDVVDCIVFWSKNPAPMVPLLAGLENYMYYFQFTLNAYGKDLEANLPTLDERIRTFRNLSERLGRRRVVWRYDPIIVNDAYTVDWHIKQFEALAGALGAFTERVVISFVDLYKNSSGLRQLRELSQTEKTALAEAFSSIARPLGLKLDTCAEEIDLSSYGIGHSSCIDGRLIAELLNGELLSSSPLSSSLRSSSLPGCPPAAEKSRRGIADGPAPYGKKDKNQRPACGCAASIDIGFYNTCQNGCAYCYANHSTAQSCAYDPASPLLCSQLTELDKLTERTVKRQWAGI